MKLTRFSLLFFLSVLCQSSMVAQSKASSNPIIFADVPDMSMIRVGDTYYMSSTTMHMNPGVPIMKSKDLVNWELVNYAYNTLGDMDELNLNNGKNNYGKGSWASTIRFHNGLFYVSTFAQTTNKTYIFTTKDIEKGPWVEHSFKPSYHDNSLFFDLVGGITQPIFNKGKNRANLKIAKAQQQETFYVYKKTLLTAGQEVSNALYSYQTATEKEATRKKQLESLEKSVDFTKELLRYNSSTNYTDVLTSEQSLLSAQLSSVSDRVQKLQAIVTLYKALGGGWK